MCASRMQAGFFTGVARAWSLAAAVARRTVLWNGSTMAQAQTNVRLPGRRPRSLSRSLSLPAVAAAVVKNGKSSLPARSARAGSGTTRRSRSMTVPHRLRHQGDDIAAGGHAGEEGSSAEHDGGEIYPNGRQDEQGVKTIKLEQLLSHTSGIPADSMEHVPLISSSVTDEAVISTACATRSSRACCPCRCISSPRAFRIFQPGLHAGRRDNGEGHGQTWEELVGRPDFRPAEAHPPASGRSRRRQGRCARSAMRLTRTASCRLSWPVRGATIRW